MTKVCNACRLELPLSAFNIHNSRKDNHQQYCKSCQKIQKAKAYYKSKISTILKYGNQCANCGFNSIPALHFHHLNGRDGSDRKGTSYFNDLNNAPRRDDIILLCTVCHAAIHQPEPSRTHLLEIARRTNNMIKMIIERHLKNALQEAIRIQCLKRKM